MPANQSDPRAALLEARPCKCGKPHDGWPGDGGGQLCQMCWEAECSESWWRMVQQLPGAVMPASERGGEGKHGN